MYDLTMADPAWDWQNFSGDGPGIVMPGSRGANGHYPTMALEDICSLSIPTAPDSVLLLWACWPLLPEALRVIDAWGFEYKTLAWVWVKANRSGMGHHMGMGYWTRANSEPCLLGTRGRGLRRYSKDVLSLIYAPVRRHSQKPDEQYGKIDRLFGPDIRKLEMFARRPHVGWDVWGNEVESDCKIETAGNVSRADMLRAVRGYGGKG